MGMSSLEEADEYSNPLTEQSEVTTAPQSH